MEELIRIDDFTTQQLPYYVRFTADMIVAKPSLYKEDVHTTLYQVINQLNPQYFQRQYVLNAFWNVEVADNDKLIFSYVGQPAPDFQNVLKVGLADNHVRIEYLELRNDNFLLPNNGLVLAVLICISETIGRLSNGFIQCKMDINYLIDTNARIAYHPANCHFSVMMAATSTYYAGDKTQIPAHIEKDEAIYIILRRFLQIYKSETLCNIPYIGLDKTQFDKDYAVLWQS